MLNFITIILTIITINNPNLTAAAGILATLQIMSLQAGINSNNSYLFSSDLISFWMITITIIVFYILSIINQNNETLYNKIIITIIIILTATFSSWNFLTFYLIFEISIIIVLLIIIYWGYQPERTEAIIFIIVITLMFSLPFLTALIKSNNTLNFWFTEVESNLITFLSFIFIFIINIPIYFTHFWLPNVHVEAPAQGSIILAAILLKLGCYGIIRIAPIVINFQNINPIFITVSIVSIIILSINCIVQTDLNSLVAYSSIVHITIVFINIIIINTNSIFSSLLIILGHGICAASLFYITNSIYNNSNSRSVILNNSILTNMPAITLMWFGACINNAPIPPSINMLGEIVSFNNILSWSEILYLPVIAAALLSSTYSIYLFYAPAHGNSSNIINSTENSTSVDSIIITAIVTPITVITLNPALLTI